MAFVNNDAGFSPKVSENHFKEIIAQRDELTVIDGGRLAPPQADTSYYAGLCVAQYSSGPNAGLYVPYQAANASATDGSGVPVGFLLKDANVGADGSGSEDAVVTKGFLFADLLVTLAGSTQSAGIAQAIVDALKGRIKKVHGQNVLAF